MRNRRPITLDDKYENFLKSCEDLIDEHWQEMEEHGIDVSWFARRVAQMRRAFLIEQTARLRG